MKYAAFLVVVLAGLAATSASDAQTRETARNVVGKPGDETRLGLFGGLTPECTPDRMPPLRILAAPANGTLVIASGMTEVPANASSCAKSRFPVLAVFYRPNAGFEGQDRTRLGLGFQPDNLVVQDITIVVRP